MLQVWVWFFCPFSFADRGFLLSRTLNFSFVFILVLIWCVFFLSSLQTITAKIQNLNRIWMADFMFRVFFSGVCVCVYFGIYVYVNAFLSICKSMTWMNEHIGRTNEQTNMLSFNSGFLSKFSSFGMHGVACVVPTTIY